MPEHNGGLSIHKIACSTKSWILNFGQVSREESITSSALIIKSTCYTVPQGVFSLHKHISVLNILL